MNKKGELTTQQIVMLIILILSFVVILFFLFRLNLGKESEQDICHNSVVMRGNSALPTESFPLNCQRQYVCITEDGSCEDLVSPIIKKVDTIDDVYETLAIQMQECWWMFGEGKVNYVGTDFLSDLYCSICSQVSLDADLKNLEGFEESIDEREFYKYLELNEVSEGKTYLNYLFGMDSVDQLEMSFSEEGGTFGTFNLGKQYFVMTGIYSEVGAWKWATGGAIVAGLIAAPFTGGASLGISAIFIGGSAIAGGYAGTYIATAIEGNGVDNDFLSPTILEANSEEFKAFNCEDVLTLA